ncbi:hypothetical protein QJQ45_019792 [Haematococcus lacustris]|nr:hypothetical protein QJQ45_019792 [Haematococcus lacustris]
MEATDSWNVNANFETAGTMDAVSHCISQLPGKRHARYGRAVIAAILLLLHLQLTHCCGSTIAPLPTHTASLCHNLVVQELQQPGQYNSSRVDLNGERHHDCDCQHATAHTTCPAHTTSPRAQSRSQFSNQRAQTRWLGINPRAQTRGPDTYQRAQTRRLNPRAETRGLHANPKAQTRRTNNLRTHLHWVDMNCTISSHIARHDACQLDTLKELPYCPCLHHAGQAAQVTVKIGANTAFNKVALGRALPARLYTGPTAAGYLINRRRIDPRLTNLPAAALSGYTANRLMTMLWTGHILKTEPLSTDCILPMMNKTHSKETTAAQLERWTAGAIGPNAESSITAEDSRTFKLGPPRAPFDCIPAKYTEQRLPSDIPAILAAHASSPYLTDVATEHGVTLGRMNLILQEDQAQTCQYSTKVTIHLQPHAGCQQLGLSHSERSRPTPPALMRQAIHSAAAGIVLADMGAPCSSSAEWDAYVAKQGADQGNLAVLQALSPSAVTQGQGQTDYTIHSDNPQLEQLLSRYRSIQVEIAGVFTITIGAATPPAAPGLGMPAKKQAGVFNPDDLLSLLYLLQDTHLATNPNPIGQLIKGNSVEGARWRDTAGKGQVRPLSFSSVYGDVITPMRDAEGRYLELTYTHPITQQVGNAKPTNPTQTSAHHNHNVATTITVARSLYILANVDATQESSIKLRGSTAPQGAVLAFCTPEGHPLNQRRLETAAHLILIPASRQDALSMIAAMQQLRGLAQSAGSRTYLGVQSRWLGGGRRSREPVWLADIKDPIPGNPARTVAVTLAENFNTTGLHYTPDQGAFTLRAVVAMAKPSTMQDIPGANVLHDIQSAATDALVQARVATTGQLDYLKAVKDARAQVAQAAEETLEPEAPGGWGLRVPVQSDEMQPLPPSAPALPSSAAAPPPPTWGTSGRGKSLPPHAPAKASRGPTPGAQARGFPPGGRGNGSRGGSSRGNSSRGNSSRGSSGSLGDFDNLTIDTGNLAKTQVLQPNCTTPMAMPTIHHPLTRTLIPAQHATPKATQPDRQPPHPQQHPKGPCAAHHMHRPHLDSQEPEQAWTRPREEHLAWLQQQASNLTPHCQTIRLTHSHHPPIPQPGLTLIPKPHSTHNTCMPPSAGGGGDQGTAGAGITTWKDAVRLGHSTQVTTAATGAPPPCQPTPHLLTLTHSNTTTNGSDTTLWTTNTQWTHTRRQYHLHLPLDQSETKDAQDWRLASTPGDSTSAGSLTRQQGKGQRLVRTHGRTPNTTHRTDTTSPPPHLPNRIEHTPYTPLPMTNPHDCPCTGVTPEGDAETGTGAEQPHGDTMNEHNMYGHTCTMTCAPRRPQEPLEHQPGSSGDTLAQEDVVPME